jgi:hypothetical protein
MKTLETISITQTKKGHRVWIQALASKGITSPFVYISYTSGAIDLLFSDNPTMYGQKGRKVTQAKGGIVDMESKKVTQWAQGSSQATVEIAGNTISIRRA